MQGKLNKLVSQRELPIPEQGDDLCALLQY